MDELRTGSGNKLPGILFAGMVLLMFAGLIVFGSGKANIPGQEPSAARCVFIVVNAATLTGFELTTAINEYKPLGQITIHLLILGGSLMSLIVGGWALVRILNMPYADDQVVRAALFEFLLVLLGAAVLMGPAPTSQGQLGSWPALFQATSALANAGQVLGTPLNWMEARTHLVLLPLAVIGGLGVPVLLDLSSSLRLGHRWHSHTRAVLALTAGIYIVGTLLIALLEWDPAAEKIAEKVKECFVLGSAESLNSRTLGMPLGSFPLLSPASQWVVMVLMFIGGSPAGTAGGIKSITALVLVRDSWRTWRGEAAGKTLGLAVLWTIVYLIAILTTTVLLAIAHPQMPGERMLFLAISAISNTGTSHAPLSLPPMGSYVLSVAMFFGRFAPLLILWRAAHNEMKQEG